MVRNSLFGRLGKISIAFALGIFCFTFNTFGQGTSLQGTVKDQNDAVVTGATVTITNSATGTQRKTTTDASGKYSFSNLSPGPSIIRVQQSGFSDAEARVSVVSGESIDHDFSISPGSLSAEVTVTAAKGLRATGEIPQTVTVVGDAEISERRPTGVNEAYERSPSVLSTDPNPFRARPQIRGLQASRILVTVDGERINNARFSADFVGVSTSLVDTSQIDQVEVVAGSGSSLYGSDAVGGTINLITKGPEAQPDRTRFDARLDADWASNNNYRKGVIQVGLAGKRGAGKVSFGRFIQPNYKHGDGTVTRQEMITFGDFAQQAGNFSRQAIISAYPIYDLDPEKEVTTSGARGYLGSGDVQFFPAENHILRLRFQHNSYRDLGVPFSGPPYTTNQANTGFSNFEKYSARYEWSGITDWFARFSVNFYRQDYRRSLDEIRNGIVQGSSWAPLPPPLTFLNGFTGNVSTFAKSAEAKTINHNTQKGFDVQLNFLPFENFIYTTGVNYNDDFSRDQFRQTNFATFPGPLFGSVLSSVDGVKNTPDTVYENWGWYNQMEYTPHQRIRFSGGFRYDNWQTEARPSAGFPNGNVGNILLAILPQIQANPGSIDAAGAAGYADLAAGRTLSTNSNVFTYNIGVTGFLPGGINPYVRYSTSFREPDLLGRYLLRNFTTAPIFSLPSIVNTNLGPEKGKDIDVGVKVSRDKYRGAFSYYRNEITDATGTVLNGYCIPITSVPGLAPSPAAFGCPPPAFPTFIPNHFVQVFQTVNFAEILIRGWEASSEGDIPLGDFGSFTPFFSFSTIKAINKTPDAARLAIVTNLYNSSAPLELDGGPDDVPFYSLPNYQGSFAPRFSGAKGRWWAEYEYRFTSKVTRVDPNEISFGSTTTYSHFKAYEGLQKHSIRGGFNFGGDKLPVLVTVGVENLTDEFYYQLFQPAPGSGRSFRIGTTIKLSRLFDW